MPRSPRQAVLRLRRAESDKGSQFLEFAAFLPLVLAIVVIAMEMFAGFLALERIGGAARSGARTAAEQGTDAGQAAARESLPGWLEHADVTSGFDSGKHYVEVSVAPPFLYKSANLGFTLTRRVTMPDL
ncbi:TadE/TadG family type IV pilus assembly protein [Nocardiopsis coralliicola]